MVGVGSKVKDGIVWFETGCLLPLRWRFSEVEGVEGWQHEESQLLAAVPPKGSGKVPNTKINHRAAEGGQKEESLVQLTDD